jgi:hypothetical protein
MSQDNDYLFTANGNQLEIAEGDMPNCPIGSVEIPLGRLCVRNHEGKVVAVVHEFKDAIPALILSYKANIPPWTHPKPTEYVIKDCLADELRVMQDALGSWSVYRLQSQILLHHGRPAAFRTADEAKKVALDHVYDLTDRVSNDGYCWLEMDANLVRRH